MHNESKSIPDSQGDTVITMSLYPWMQTLLSHSVHMFLYCFCPWPYTVNVLSYCRVWLLKCCKNKNSYDIKIYFLPIKIVLYLIKYIFITHLLFHEIKIYFHWVKINFYAVRNILSHKFFFIQVKYAFIIWIFLWILFWWGYLIFL